MRSNPILLRHCSVVVVIVVMDVDDVIVDIVVVVFIVVMIVICISMFERRKIPTLQEFLYLYICIVFNVIVVAFIFLTLLQFVLFSFILKLCQLNV